MSNFQSVKEFNRAFDMVSKEPKEYIGYDEISIGIIKINPYKYFRMDIFDRHSIIRLRLNLIKEEIEELNCAIKQNDFKETRDAIGDILYVVYGMADVIGIDIDYIFSYTLHNEIIKHYINNNEHSNNIFIDKIISGTQNGLKKITNYIYVKLFLSEIINNDNDYDLNNNITKLRSEFLNKLNDEYLKLEKEFEIETIYYDTILKYKMLENKVLIISKMIYNLLKITYILANLYNINADYDFSIIHESNMSKLCDTEQDAINTVESYVIKYKNGGSPYDSPYYYELPELHKWIVKNKSSGKALKNIKYKEVSFNEI